MVTSGVVLLKSSGKRPTIWLNILQYTGQAPTMNYPAQNVNRTEAEKFWRRRIWKKAETAIRTQ